MPNLLPLLPLLTCHKEVDTPTHAGSVCLLGVDMTFLGAVCSVAVRYRLDGQAASLASVCEVVPEWGKRLLDEAPVPLPPNGPPTPR